MFHIDLQAAQGVNFPYYIMGKAQLAISPFIHPWVWMDAQADPYVLFAQEHGVEKADIGDVGDAWYDWVSQTVSNCPACARDSLQYCDSHLLPIAQRLLPEYLSRWPSIQEKFAKLLREAVTETDLSSIVRRNERLFGLSYPEDGREIVYFNLFPTMAQQKPGPHFVFGLGCLYRPESLLQRLEREVGLTLLERIFEDERVCLSFGRVEALTKQDQYVQGRGSVLEALNNVIRAIEKYRGSITLQHIPWKPGEQGYRQIVESLFRHRHLWRKVVLCDFVIASLDAIAV